MTFDTYDSSDKIPFEFKKDPKLNDETMLPMGERDFSYKELNDICPKHDLTPISCLVYWDDVCQYTSIALIELLNDICESEAIIDFEHFFTRPNEYIYGMDYVYKLFSKILKKEEIDNIKQHFYWNLLTASLKSTVFNSLIKTNSFYNRLGFYFPFRFEHCEELRLGLNELFFPKSTQNNVKFYYASDNVVFEDILKNEKYTSIITPNVSKTYEYIIDNKIKRVDIIGPEEHNGITEEIYNIFKKYKGLPLPNYCSLNLYKEQIMDPNE